MEPQPWNCSQIYCIGRKVTLINIKVNSDCIFILSRLDRADEVKFAAEQFIKSQGVIYKYPRKPDFWNH